MPDVLGHAGVYFDPERPIEIYTAIKEMIDNPQLRLEKSRASFHRAQQYSWDVCAVETFLFLEQVLTNYQKSLCAE